MQIAVNYASKSRPPMLSELYTGAKLDQQFDRVTRDFINDGRSNYVKKGALYVSRIFKRFGQIIDSLQIENPFRP